MKESHRSPELWIRYIALRWVGLIALGLVATYAQGETLTASDPLAQVVVSYFGTKIVGNMQTTSGGSAVILDNQFAVTAAHVPLVGGSGQLRFGVGPGYIERTVINVIRHPGWVAPVQGAPDDNDIALLQFSGGLPTGFTPAEVSYEAVSPGLFPGPGEFFNVSYPPPTGTVTFSTSFQTTLAGFERSTSADPYGTLAAVMPAFFQLEPSSHSFLTASPGMGLFHGDSGGGAFLSVASHRFQIGINTQSDAMGIGVSSALDISSYIPWLLSQGVQIQGGPVPWPQIFDPQFYLDLNPDVAAYYGSQNIDSGVTHWLLFGRTEGRSSSPAFNPIIYLVINPDLTRAFGGNIADAIYHWLTTGQTEGRRASLAFDSQYYLTTYPDLAAAFGTGGASSPAALRHWFRFGIAEGRRPTLEFDPAYYLAYYPDLTQAFGPTNYRSALVHYLVHGVYEGRRGSRFFDPQIYLARYPDLQRAYGTTGWYQALLHWLAFGKSEGRTGAP